ncbi:hypothetical protein [Streptomyces sp. NPDC058964]|uniref:hypothetical protein n=1 Tax=Streptomyces sp. NPDC058964 TaxID=3346681 RepID=UPI0036CD3765
MSPTPGAVWFVIRGESPYAQAIEPDPYGIPIPDAVLTWAVASTASRFPTPC